MLKRAIILAGGLGTRLRPYSVVLPKPLMPIGQFSILEIIIKQLINHDFKHITLAVNHQADIIKAVFGDGKNFGIKIDYSLEHRPLGTMGPLKLIKDLPLNFLVMNGDILTDLNFSKFFDEHVKTKSLFTISSFERSEKVDYGVLTLNSNGMLDSFLEKPIYKFIVSMGIYAVNKNAVGLIPKNKKFGFDDLMIKIIKKNLPVSPKLHDGYWLDIGRPDDYFRAIEEWDKKRKIFLK